MAPLSATILSFLDGLHLNFFRIHVIWFTINPLFWSLVFWAANGEYPVSYVDSLFLCVSSNTVTGLTPINLSTTTGFQQFILFYLMCIGNYTVVSLVMVLVRKNYIVQKVLTDRPSMHLPNMVDRAKSRTIAILESAVGHHSFPAAGEKAPNSTEVQRSTVAGFRYHTAEPSSMEYPSKLAPTTGDAPDEKHPRPDSPVGATPGLQNDSKLILADNATAFKKTATSSPPRTPRRPFHSLREETLYRVESPSAVDQIIPTTPGQVNFAIPLTRSPTTCSRRDFPARPADRPTMSRTGTIIVAPVPGPARQGTGLFFSNSSEPAEQPPTTLRPTSTALPMSGAQTEPGSNLPPATSAQQMALNYTYTPATYETNFGGFPGPISLADRFIKQVAPRQYEAFKRKLTIDDGGVYTQIKSKTDLDAEMGVGEPQTTAVTRTRTGHTLRNRPQRGVGMVPEVSNDDSTTTPRAPLAPPYMSSTSSSVPEHLRHHLPGHVHSSDQTSHTGWMNDMQENIKRSVFFLKKERNSAFNTDELTDDELEALGGIEYRALRALAWIVGLYYVGTQFLVFVVFTAYLSSTSKYDAVFTAQSRLVPKAWFSAFQSVSSYTGGGLSLVDEGMVPFMDAYLLVVFQAWLIAAGTLILPILLRLIVWILWRLANETQRPALEFLLNHPRRCYIYLFPSHQTWFLLFVFLLLTFIMWSGFLILDIGIPAIDAIPVGTRVLSSLFQSVSVRASGFPIVPLEDIAPAVKFLYVVMMYISAYPIAMSIRSTNVYEQRSLGIYESVIPLLQSGDPDVDERAAKLVRGSKGEVLFSKYLGMHVRRQLSFDLWWLALAVFLISVVERAHLMDSENAWWFNQLQIVFELVSAYATVGLSLGIPTENYSFSGALGPLSKLILCLVMIRGRHRDLPQAIDRAILLPHELSRVKINAAGDHIMDTERDKVPIQMTTVSQLEKSQENGTTVEQGPS